MTTGAGAADADGAKTELDTVFVTGSRIKRLDGETALPIEIITRDEMRERRVITAAEIVRTLSANNAPLSGAPGPFPRWRLA